MSTKPSASALDSTTGTTQSDSISAQAAPSKRPSRKKTPASSSPTATLQAVALTQDNDGTESPFAQLIKTGTRAASSAAATTTKGDIHLPPKKSKERADASSAASGGNSFADSFTARGFSSNDANAAQSSLVVEDMGDVLARLKAKTAARRAKSSKSKSKSTTDDAGAAADASGTTTAEPSSASTKSRRKHASTADKASTASTGQSRAMSTSSKSSMSKLPPPPLPAPGTGSDAKDIKRSRRRKSKKAAEDDHGLTDPSSEDESGPLLAKISRSAEEPLDFNQEVQKLFESQRASPEALAARQQLIDELENYFNNDGFRWGHPHSKFKNPIRIEAFGSVRFGLATSSSDLDLCMFDPYRPNGFEDKYFSLSREYLKRLPDIYDMRVVARKLYFAGVQKVQAIPTAGVPIVKFEVKIGGQRIQADINTNERLGVLNSRLINAYCELHPFIRPLCVLVKFYCKQRNLNDPSGAKGPVTFSSYTLIVMVIAYLQTINFVPNLQDFGLIVEHGVEPQRFFSTPRVRYRRNKMVKVVRSVGWDVTFVEDLKQPEDWARPEGAADMDLKQLARGFFDYFGDKFNPEREIVAIQNGAPRARERDYVDPHVKEDEAGKESDGRPAAAAATAVDDIEAKEDGVDSADAPAVEAEGLVEVSTGEALAAAAKVGSEPASVNIVSIESAPQDVQRQPEDYSALESHAEAQQQEVEQVRAVEELAHDEHEYEHHLEHDDDDDQGLGATEDVRDGADAALDDLDSFSRGSSPIPFTDFFEPMRWSQRLMIVQDPFDLTRNTANNVEPDIVELLRCQFRRARDMIDDGESIATICASIKHEPGYLSLAEQRQAWRRQRKRADASLNLRNADIIRSAKREMKVKAAPAGHKGAEEDEVPSSEKTKGKGKALDSTAPARFTASGDASELSGSTEAGPRIFDDQSSNGSDDEGLPDEAWMLEGIKKLGSK